MILKSSSYWSTVSLSKYEDNSDPIPKPAVVLVACSKALADVLLHTESGWVEEIQEPILDELELEAPSDAKILLQVVFFLPVKGCCADFCNLTTPNLLTSILVKHGCKLNSYLSEVSRIISASTFN
jgi:hypothetical protein